MRSQRANGAVSPPCCSRCLIATTKTYFAIYLQRSSETLPKAGDRLLLIALVIVIFTVCFQLIYHLINHWRGKLNQRFHRPVQAARLEGAEQP